MSGAREILLFKAELAKECLRYDEASTWMHTLSDALDEEMEQTERQLLSLVLKQKLEALRAAFQSALLSEQKESGDERKKIAKEYRMKLQEEFCKFCHDTISVVERNIDTSISASVSTRMFWLKLLGDYWRYIAEVDRELGTKSDIARNAAESAYRAAIELAGSVGVPIADAVRLGAYLNYSVLLFEVLEDQQGAMKMCRAILDKAADEGVRDANNPEIDLICGYFDKNLALWEDAIEADEEDEIKRDMVGSASNVHEEIDLSKLHL